MKHDTDWIWIAGAMAVLAVCSAAAYANRCATERFKSCVAYGMRVNEHDVCVERMKP